jgi:hypothetical protein
LEKGFGGERRPKDKVTIPKKLVYALAFTHLQNIYTRVHVSVFNKYFLWPCVNISVKSSNMYM